MKSKWKIMHQRAADETLIRVCRIKDIGQPVHAGNLEFFPETFATDKEAQAVVDRLNQEFADGHNSREFAAVNRKRVEGFKSTREE